MEEKALRSETGAEIPSREKSEPLLTRREFLGDSASALAWAALGVGVHTAWQRFSSSVPEQKEAALFQLIRETEESLKHGDGARILKEGTSFEVYSLLFAPDSPLRQFGMEVLKGTHLDPSSSDVYPYFPSVQIRGVLKPADPHPDNPEYKERVEIAVHDNRHPADMRSKRSEAVRYGNGIVLSEKQVLSNGHVLQDFVGDSQAGVDVHPEPGVDAAIMNLPSYAEIPADVVAKMPRWEFMKDENLHGTFVVAAGIDPDVSANPHGLKYFGGFLIEVSMTLLEKTGMHDRMTDPGRFTGEYLFIGVPVGQALPTHISRGPFMSVQNIYARGMSGSPLLPLANPGGRTMLAGATTAVMTHWNNPGAPKNESCCYEMVFITKASAFSKLSESSKWETL